MTTRPIRIIHCLRAPVGGLFRHVRDLARGQAEAGCHVGIICDAGTGDVLTEEALTHIRPYCMLGIKRIPMHRQVSPSDIIAALKVRMWCTDTGADIIHGHGAKGGAFGRFAAALSPTKAFYTPHGGSLHYSADTWSGWAFLRLERLLRALTDGLIFESEFGYRVYRRKVGTPACDARIIHNGLSRSEFAPVPTNQDAADLLFIGELRELKGVDVLLHALHRVRQVRDVSAVIVGDGPEAQTFKDLASSLGLSEAVRFSPPQPAREAFALGRTLIVPSRAESLPYVVLESLAARKPTIATDVGGVSEIFRDRRDSLLPAGDVEKLAEAICATIADPRPLQVEAIELSADLAKKFTTAVMVDEILNFYATKAGTVATADTSRQSPTAPAK